MRLYTIGFTKKTAEQFFVLLQQNGVQRVVDIRVHPNSQLSGFARQQDLRYFLPQLIQCAYDHVASLCPTEEILTDYRKTDDWGLYVQRFEQLMDERNVPGGLDRASFENSASCLLCSEATPEQCHRRLVAERLARFWPDVEIIHLT